MNLKSLKKYFTLIELLVVISVLVILMSLLFPSLQSVVYESNNLNCLNHIKSLTQGTLLYCDDNADLYPARNKGNLISGRHPNRVTTTPHSSDTIRVNSKTGLIRGDLQVSGAMNVNYTYDDGSAKKRYLLPPDWNIHSSKINTHYADWHYLPVPGQPFKLYPKN
jgi:type II secretory pathway pseudopilin PulG